MGKIYLMCVSFPLPPPHRNVIRISVVHVLLCHTYHSTHTAYARDHQPCIIFMDEIDAIGGRRFSEGTSADREIQRTLMELLNQMDGFDRLGQVKMIMATNRPDVLDPALLRPGRLDRKIGKHVYSGCVSLIYCSFIDLE